MKTFMAQTIILKFFFIAVIFLPLGTFAGSGGIDSDSENGARIRSSARLMNASMATATLVGAGGGYLAWHFLGDTLGSNPLPISLMATLISVATADAFAHHLASQRGLKNFNEVILHPIRTGIGFGLSSGITMATLPSICVFLVKNILVH